MNDTDKLQESNSAINTPLVENINSLLDPCVYIHAQKSRNFISRFPTSPSDSYSPPVIRYQTIPQEISSEPSNINNSKKHKPSRLKVQKSSK
jgi:hypothetical protein